MKKIFALLLCVVMAVSMIASVSAIKPDKEYAAAKDGDVLYTANFKDPAYGSLFEGTTATFTPSSDGTSVTFKGTGSSTVHSWLGVKLETLGAANGEKYTVTYKVKTNGTVGKNNSVGVGGLWAGTLDEKFYTAYGNYNTVDDKGDTTARRISLSLGGTKVGDYNEDVDKPDIDKDGFVTAKQEIDTAAKTITIYMMIGGKWFKAVEKTYTEIDTAKACMAFAVYVWYTVVDTTVKDFKIYKGIGLSDDQLNPKPAETTAAETTTVAAPAPEAPATFDGAVALAAVAAAALSGVVVSKKRK